MQPQQAFGYLKKLIPLWLIAWIIYSAIKYPFFFSVFFADGIAIGAIYALVAFGFGLIYNVTGVLNLAHGEIFMFGAVISTSIFVKHLHATEPNLRNWIWLFIILLLCMAIGAFFSWTNEVLVFRRLRRANIIAPLIASLGLSLIYQNLGIFINGSGKKTIDTIIPKAPPFLDLPASIERTAILMALVMPLLLFFSFLATRSKNGLAIKAVAANSEISELMGINVNKTISRVFLIAGAAAGAAGILYTQEFRVSNYNLGVHIGLIAYAAAVIGGISNIRGTILGGFAVGLIQELGNGVPSGLGYRWSETAIYTVFILTLVYRPQGIFGYEAENV